MKIVLVTCSLFIKRKLIVFGAGLGLCLCFPAFFEDKHIYM